MAWVFTNINYTWKIATNIVLAAVSIFTADNTRYRVNQTDVIPPILGTYERAFVTTNAYAGYWDDPWWYYGDPYTYTRSWYSNAYETTNLPGDLTTNWTAVLYTNVFTNAIGFRIDHDMVEGTMEDLYWFAYAFIRTNTLYEGSWSIYQDSLGNILQSMSLGNGINFTVVPCWTNNPGATNEYINPPVYGINPLGRVYSVTLQEMYKVLWSMKLTRTKTGHFIDTGYYGHGLGLTYEDAYDMAVASYTSYTPYQPLVAKDHFYQWCVAVRWSNMVAQGGSGATNETGLPVAGTEWNDWHEDHHDYVRTDLEVMNMPTTNSLTVSYSSITNLIYTYVTNLTVTGEDLDPNIAGTYVEIAPYVGFRRWEGTLGAILSGAYTNNPGNIYVTVGGTYWTWLGPMWTAEGDYIPFPLGGGVPTGTAHVVYDVIETITTNGATPVDYSGTYYPTTAENVWRGGAGYIFITNGSYVIYSSLELNTNEAYLSSGTKLGMYSAVNFTATNIVSAGGGESQPCVGTFTGTPMEPWFMGTWACTNSEGVFTIRDMSDSIISIWVKAGYDTNPVGIYTASGPECFGSVTSALLNVYNDWHEDHHDPVYHTHTWGTNTIFYECWLRKEAPWRTMVTNLYTNIEHRTQFWVYPSGVQAGGFNGIQTNTFNDEDIGFTRENWQSAVIGNWTDWDFETYAVVDDYWTSLLSTPPEMAPEPPVLTVNSRVIDGFYIDRYNFLGVMDWKFQYCTNKYW